MSPYKNLIWSYQISKTDQHIWIMEQKIKCTYIIFYFYTTTAQFLWKIWRHKWYHGESRKCTNGKNFIEVLMIPYRTVKMTPNLMKAELISASPKLKMDSINHSNALFGHSNEDSSKKKNGIFLFFPSER